MFSCKFHFSETEQIRWSTKEDWEADGFGRGIPATQPPPPPPRKKRYFSTTVHDIGAHCEVAGYANIGSSWKYFWTGNYFRNQELIMLSRIGEKGWRGTQAGGGEREKERKGVARWKVYT